ncbi:hypothetical protein [Hyalangium versicolor]|uniref:hypothetical protein n=1 Tax=Hyalangium versicolor TaxID=2861190 RepID=UPI001CCDB4F2|nr:hypothetical protein [Hyalangium versicolor]
MNWDTGLEVALGAGTPVIAAMIHRGVQKLWQKALEKAAQIDPKTAPPSYHRAYILGKALGTVAAMLLKPGKARRPKVKRFAGSRTVERATYFLDLLSMVVPKRIANEEIGDAVELIHRMAKVRRPKWFIALKVATTYFWVGVHTLLHCAEQVAGIVSLARGKGDKD